ncbi:MULTISPECIES: helix-turn-helix domain-containing protein [Streptomyces]|uniref:helix-turn-helix domain-containing protein n=1 Tax=Streptomyces TaxID=1883 RepID=UPI00224995BB|nr:helix-turn-helix transcriptional regulator [Streptomyces sp. JHD 1]MCX2969307.1 helix-turn-helix transcriptional regulator [Streptomyces sp. JHD 1]
MRAATDEAKSETVNGKPVSPRELQVLRCVAAGLTYGQTATRLGISVHTVNTYVRRIRHKFAAETHANLVRLGIAFDSRDSGETALPAERKDFH